jgi:hypothetical protein
MNDDGNRLYATAESKLWISDNFGKTWTQKTIKTAEEGDKEDEWIAGFSYVSCNGKGNAITFTTEYDNIYLSNDYGETFSPILEPELASEFPWAYPIVNKNGIGLTVGQSSGIIFSTREKLTDEKDYLVIENASEMEEKLNQFIIDDIETVQNELDEKKMNELKDTIDDVDRDIYGTDNVYFEKTGVEERDYEEVFAEILANANINANM